MLAPGKEDVFENLCALVDRSDVDTIFAIPAAFALVRALCKHCRRPTKGGIVSPFSGLLYCAEIFLNRDTRAGVLLQLLLFVILK